MRIVTALLLSLAVVACGDPAGPGQTRYPQLWIGQTGLVMAPGEEAKLSASIHRSFYHLIEDATGARWWSGDDTVLEVSGEGRVRALAPGRASVWVELEGAIDSGTILVREAPSYETRWAAVSVGLGSGGLTTCALDLNGRAYCWGSDYWGELGNGTRRRWTGTYAPVAVAGSRSFAEIAVGGDHACARSAAGRVFCWGDVTVVGTAWDLEEHVLEPTEVDFTEPFVRLRAGFTHTCGLTADGRAYCWGVNARGELGDGTAGIPERRFFPTPVNTDLRFVEIVPARWRTCALTTEGAAYCWGSGGGGMLGTGDEQDRLLPTAVLGGHRFVLITGTGHHTCGRTPEHAVHCWGPNASYQLGRADLPFALAPVEIEHGEPYQELYAGEFNTCGWTFADELRCWGWDGYGNLGSGAPSPHTCSYGFGCSPHPLDVAGGQRFVSISASVNTTCGVTDLGALYCWGLNRHGQLGIGSLQEMSNAPVRVVDPM